MEIKQLSYKTIMQSKTTELHFPFLYEKNDKEWYMTYREGPHGVPGGDFVKCVKSFNQGETWQPWEGLGAEPRLRWFRTILKDGSMISHRYRLKKGVNDYYGYILRSNNKGKNWIKSRCDVYGISIDDDYAYMWGNIVEDNEENLYVIAYGTCEDKYINMIMTSHDKGQSWNPFCHLGIENSSFTEGPCEGSLVFLDDGRILAVYRTGGPLIYSLSDHTKKHFIHFVLDNHGVSPQLLKMGDMVICTYGIRDIKMRYFHNDRFSEVIDVYTGSGSGYTDIQQLSNNRFRIVFDQSDFLINQIKGDKQRLVRVEYKIEK